MLISMIVHLIIEFTFVQNDGCGLRGDRAEVVDARLPDETMRLLDERPLLKALSQGLVGGQRLALDTRTPLGEGGMADERRKRLRRSGRELGVREDGYGILCDLWPWMKGLEVWRMERVEVEKMLVWGLLWLLLL
jgi:hypothetical protein